MNTSLSQVFSCSSCPLSFTAPVYLLKHIRGCRYEEYVRLLKSGEIKYENIASGQQRSSGTKKSLRQNWQCSDCGRSFIQQSNLEIHQRVHTGEKPHHCSQCRTSFTRESHLNLHQRTHTGQKPHQCSYCDKRFTDTGNLNTHERVHTGERPHQCSVCGKRFTQQGDLQLHKQRVHAGEKPPS